jgi:hypothetical protein
MYAGSIVRSNTKANTSADRSNAFLGIGDVAAPATINTGFADKSWKVMTGVTTGNGVAVAGRTGMLDGACLKCHVAIDSASTAAAGSLIGTNGVADAIRHEKTLPLVPGASGYLTGSSRVFLYK